MVKKIGDYNLTFEQALLEAIKIESREFDEQYKPDIQGVKTHILRTGQQSHKIAKYWTLRDRHTGQPHHHTLTLETIKRVKKHNGWIQESKHTITLSDEDDDEIGKLLNFLSTVPEISEKGEYVVINAAQHDERRLRQILDAIANSGHKLDLLQEILTWTEVDPQVTAGLTKIAADYPFRSKSLAAALNYGRYKRALDEFKNLVEEDQQERIYQSFLEHNEWMFGSEYSELLPKRALALGIQLDFPMRRTVDGYLEIIEIKRPLNDKPLFLQDSGHDAYYPRNELNKAIAQVRKYLRQIDAQQHRIKVEDDLDVEKVRSKIIIGRSGIDKEQIKQLRFFTADDSRVEVWTYDQLIKVAERVLEILADEAELMDISEERIETASEQDETSHVQNIDDIPF